MKITKTHFSALFIMLALLTVLSYGCKKDDDDKPETGTADFKVNLSSSETARNTYEEVNIDIVKVSIHTSSDSAEASGWFDLVTNTGIYDLLDYDAGNDTLIGFDSVLNVQTISQIRLLLSDNNTIVDGGETFDLDTPSAQTSGIKIQVHSELQAGMSYKILLDFDSEKSIVKTGNGKYKLTPSIKATVIQF